MRAVLDACVLFPTILREILTGCAARGLYAPVWSPRILAEWTHAARRLGPEQGPIAAAEALLLDEAFPAASVTPQAGADHLRLPDEADRHVIEAALAAGAPLIVTLNLRDFPPRALAPLGLRAQHPDPFLLGLAAAAPDAVSASVKACLARAHEAGGQMSGRDMLRRAGLPRLAKALGPAALG